MKSNCCGASFRHYVENGDSYFWCNQCGKHCKPAEPRKEERVKSNCHDAPVYYNQSAPWTPRCSQCGEVCNQPRKEAPKLCDGNQGSSSEGLELFARGRVWGKSISTALQMRDELLAIYPLEMPSEEEIAKAANECFIEMLAVEGLPQYAHAGFTRGVKWLRERMGAK